MINGKLFVIGLFLVAATVAQAAQNTIISEDNSEQIAALKTQIVQIARAAQKEYDSDDNDRKVRAQLDPLVDELMALSQIKNEKQKFPQLVGSWKQIWSDSPGSAKGTGPLGAFVFQVVSPKGYFWNITKNKYPTAQNMNYLRGSFVIHDNAWEVRIAKSVLSLHWVDNGTPVLFLAEQAEAGAFDASPFPYPPETSPIGKFGVLANVFVDKDIRICRSGGDAFKGTFLYILERGDRF